MRWQNRRRSDNVEDRRGASPSRLAIGGGVGTLAVVVIALLFGADPGSILDQLQGTQVSVPSESGVVDPAQAQVACAIAGGSGGRRRIRSHRGLGAQRYLWTISKERDPDPLELAIGRLIEIDRRRGSDLFRTLETYLDQQGNARQAAAALYIHRNTLRLRLRRIAELVGLDPTDRGSWLDLVLAVRLIRFRALGDA